MEEVWKYLSSENIRDAWIVGVLVELTMRVLDYFFKPVKSKSGGTYFRFGNFIGYLGLAAILFSVVFFIFIYILNLKDFLSVPTFGQYLTIPWLAKCFSFGYGMLMITTLLSSIKMIFKGQLGFISMVVGLSTMTFVFCCGVLILFGFKIAAEQFRGLTPAQVEDSNLFVNDYIFKIMPFALYSSLILLTHAVLELLITLARKIREK